MLLAIFVELAKQNEIVDAVKHQPDDRFMNPAGYHSSKAGLVCLDETNGKHAAPSWSGMAKRDRGLLEDALRAMKFDVRRPNDDTALHVGSQNGHAEVVKWLVEAHTTSNLAMQDVATPLYIAAQIDHMKIMELLVEAHANVHMAAENGATPLHSAAGIGLAEAAETLVTDHANVNLAMQDRGLA